MRRLLLLIALLPLGAPARAAEPAESGPAERESRLVGRAEAIGHALEQFAGRTVTAVEVACDSARCTDPEQQRTLRHITRLLPGLPLEPMAVARGWLHLTRSGLFRQIEPVAEVDGEGVRLRFHATPHLVIDDVDLEYAELSSKVYPQQFDTEIGKRLILRKGSPFDPQDDALIQRQKAAILDLYERQGYIGTSVDIAWTIHGDRNQFVQIRIRVDEGHQPWMGQLLVRGNEAFPYSKVVEPITTGERTDFWRPVFGTLGLGRYDRRRLIDELKLVEQSYRDEDYLTARVRLRGEARRGNVVYPKIEIDEGPRVELEFDGNRRLDDEDLARVTTFGESGAIDAAEIESSIEQIRSAYQAVAHYFARVEAKAVPAAPGHARIRFDIAEGPRVYVASVFVRGNRRVDTTRVLEAMETQGIAEDGVISGFRVSPGVLQDARIANDLNKIRDMYRDLGFLGVQFRCKPPDEPLAQWNHRRLAELRGELPADAPPHFDVWTSEPARMHCFVVERTDVESLLNIHFELDEGLRTTVDKLDLDRFIRHQLADRPDLQDEADELLVSLGFKDDLGHWIKGAGLNRRKLEAVRGFLLKYFRQDGNLQAKVLPRCDDVETADVSGIDDEQERAIERSCDLDALYGRHFELLPFTMQEGPKTIVDGIVLSGNLRTDADVVTNELLFKLNEPLGSDRLFLSQANLRSLGIFRSVRVETLGEQLPVGADSPLMQGFTPRGDRRDATVMVAVEEGDYRQLDATLGLRIDSSPLGASDLPILYVAGLTLKDRNLWGRAIEVGVEGEHSNRIDTPQDVAGDDALWRGRPYLRDRRFAGTKLDLDLSYEYRLGLTEQRDKYAESHTVETNLGYEFFHISYPADWGRGVRASFNTEVVRERRRDRVTNGERPPFGEYVDTVTLGPRLDVDKRDNPLHPTRGWLLRQENKVSFGTNELAPDEINPSFRETLTGQYVHSFFDRRLIVAPTLRLGAVQTDQSEDDLLSDFLFVAGGDGVTYPVRGYLDAAIDACGGVQTETGACSAARDLDDNPRPVGGKALLAGSLELRFPTFLIDDFWFTVFGDVAAVAADWKSMESDRIFPSAGAGLRWLVTGQIPLRLDVGVPLRRNELNPTREPRFHLSIFYPL